jgi:hypothetical protein
MFYCQLYRIYAEEINARSLVCRLHVINFLIGSTQIRKVGATSQINSKSTGSLSRFTLIVERAGHKAMHHPHKGSMLVADPLCNQKTNF